MRVKCIIDRLIPSQFVEDSLVLSGVQRSSTRSSAVVSVTDPTRGAQPALSGWCPQVVRNFYIGAARSTLATGETSYDYCSVWFVRILFASVTLIDSLIAMSGASLQTERH